MAEPEDGSEGTVDLGDLDKILNEESPRHFILELVRVPEFGEREADDPVRRSFELSAPEGAELLTVLPHHEGCLFVWRKT